MKPQKRNLLLNHVTYFTFNHSGLPLLTRDCVVSSFMVLAALRARRSGRRACPERAVHPSRASGGSVSRRAHHEGPMAR